MCPYAQVLLHTTTQHGLSEIEPRLPRMGALEVTFAVWVFALIADRLQQQRGRWLRTQKLKVETEASALQKVLGTGDAILAAALLGRVASALVRIPADCPPPDLCASYHLARHLYVGYQLAISLDIILVVSSLGQTRTRTLAPAPALALALALALARTLTLTPPLPLTPTLAPTPTPTQPKPKPKPKPNPNRC